MSDKLPMQTVAELLDDYRKAKRAEGPRRIAHTVATKTEIVLAMALGQISVTLPVAVPGAGEPGTCALDYAESVTFHPWLPNGRETGPALRLDTYTHDGRSTFNRVPGILREAADDLRNLADVLDSITKKRESTS